jgi:hypothetical protein
MSNPFIDINGRVITPGCKVVIATYAGRFTKTPVLRKGVVYRTSGHLDAQGSLYGGTVGVLVEVEPKRSMRISDPGPVEIRMQQVKRWYRPGNKFMVVS